jgi:hypothetical protein
LPRENRLASRRRPRAPRRGVRPFAKEHRRVASISFAAGVVACGLMGAAINAATRPDLHASMSESQAYAEAMALGGRTSIGMPSIVLPDVAGASALLATDRGRLLEAPRYAWVSLIEPNVFPWDPPSAGPDDELNSDALPTLRAPEPGPDEEPAAP